MPTETFVPPQGVICLRYVFYCISLYSINQGCESYDTSLVAFSSFLFSTRCFPLWWYLYSPFPKCPKANAFSERECSERECSERECSERVHWISSWTSSHFGANEFGMRFDVCMSLSCTVIRRILDSYVLFFFLFRFVYRLHRETYYLALDFVDRYLSEKTNIPKQRLQLIGTTALFIAAKMEVSLKTRT